MSKKYRVKIQKEAVDDIDQIYRFIAQDKSSAARKFSAELKKKILGLSIFPTRGSPCRLFDQGHAFNDLRFVTHQGYLIFYEVKENEVLILHVTGPGQDWMNLFM